ncbi:beta-ketoacyl synthase N-terminal-like domain-containing protein [Rubritalea spongiae]|uniref:Beta-ketoacyl synthase N-terminal-like domain-containing protein n=1 Tax=Rubritalea spongiae TaxID=430797 RepID=A0ABW5E075_9BACT
MNKTISITGLSAISGIGSNLTEHAAAMENGQTGLRPLNELLGEQSDCGKLLGSWIQDRSILNSRKWAPASALALHCAKQAIADAKLTGDALTNAAVIAGSSRGNAWLHNWPGRRPFKLMAASNSMHGEIASAVSIELGITGPWQTIASGCAASLDALGMAWMMLQTGIVKHAIVLGAELPLVPEIVQGYINTGVLSTNRINDPYHPETSGFFPGEAGCALVLTTESTESTENAPLLDGYWCNSDADSPIGMPNNGRGLRKCLESALASLSSDTEVTAICPHASGTHLHSIAEEQALKDALKPTSPISLHPLKPFTGHTVGASGALDTAILAHYLRNHKLPPNLHLTQPNPPFTLPQKTSAASGTILKIAVGMGGHNSVIALRPPLHKSLCSPC